MKGPASSWQCPAPSPLGTTSSLCPGHKPPPHSLLPLPSLRSPRLVSKEERSLLQATVLFCRARGGFPVLDWLTKTLPPLGVGGAASAWQRVKKADPCRSQELKYSLRSINSVSPRTCHPFPALGLDAVTESSQLRHVSRAEIQPLGPGRSEPQHVDRRVIPTSNIQTAQVEGMCWDANSGTNSDILSSHERCEIPSYNEGHFQQNFVSKTTLLQSLSLPHTHTHLYLTTNIS